MVTTCLLKACIEDPNEIKEYLIVHPNLANKLLADYVLYASEKHLLYKYENKYGVWYVHYGPTNIFKICVYSKEK